MNGQQNILLAFFFKGKLTTFRERIRVKKRPWAWEPKVFFRIEISFFVHHHNIVIEKVCGKKALYNQFKVRVVWDHNLIHLLYFKELLFVWENYLPFISTLKISQIPLPIVIAQSNTFLALFSWVVMKFSIFFLNFIGPPP